MAVRAQIGADRFYVGEPTSHDEGTHPFTPVKSPRQVRGSVGTEKQKLSAPLIFHLAKLVLLAAKLGPTVEELEEPLDRAAPEHALRRSALDLGGS